MSHPPLPRLTLRIGVTGHRLAALEQAGSDETKLRDTIRDTLLRIAELTRDLHAENRQGYADDPVLRVISPLAEGADRLVAEEGRALGYEIQTPLPFATEVYRDDFKSPDSQRAFDELLEKSTAVFQLPGTRSAEKPAYEEVGRVVLRQSDLLVAIWDGKVEEGRGGTGQIVREAIASQVPVLWIRPETPDTVAGAVAHLQQVSEAGEAASWVAADESLPTILHEILSLPADRELRRFRRFLHERQPRFRAAISYRLFCRMFVWNWPLPKLRVSSFERSEPFVWADVLADLCADRYRSSFLGTYFLGAFAVLTALLGAQAGELPASFQPFPDAHGWFWVELGMIAAILLLVGLNKWGRWHERWIDYRLLAEGLRQMRFLAPFARVTPHFEVPPHLSEHNPRSTWFNWYFRALVRQMDLPRAKVDEQYLGTCKALLEAEIDGQIRYHRNNEQRLRSLGHRLHRLSITLFVLTFIACLLHLEILVPSETVLGTHSQGLLALFAIVLPAFGASIQGFLHQGELGRLARRSGALKNRLEELKVFLNGPRQPSFRLLGETAEGFSRLQLQEQTDWRSVFISKEVTPP